MGRLNKSVLAIAVPVILGMLSQTVVLISDTAMTGVLGKRALAATGLGGTAFWTVLSFLLGSTLGVQIITARRYGEHNHLQAGRVLLTALATALVLGTILTVGGLYFSRAMVAPFAEDPGLIRESAGYLRLRFMGLGFYFLAYVLTGFYNGLGDTQVTMISYVGTAVSNIFFNYCLIYGNLGFPELGIEGAAIASNLAGMCGVAAVIPYLFEKRMRRFYGRIGRHTFDQEILKEITKVSLPPGLESFFMHIAFLLFYKLSGWVSEASMAAGTVIVSILSFSFMPGFAFGIAATTLVGQAMGARQYNRARLATQHAAFFAALVLTSIGLILYIWRGSITELFVQTPDVIRESVAGLTVIALMQPVEAYSMTFAGALRGAGLVNYVMVSFAGLALVFMVPAAYVLGILLGLGTAGLWAGAGLWMTILAIQFRLKFKGHGWESHTV